MYLKIRIPSDRRSKMTVISGRQTKMSAAFRGIFCLLHGAKCKPADHCLIRKILNAFQNFLNLFGRDLLSGFPHVDPLIVKKHQKLLHLVRIRIFMGSVNKRIFALTVFSGHCFICQKHKVLNNLCRNISVIRFDIDWMTILIKNHFRFRKIEINGTSLFSSGSQNLWQFQHTLEHRHQFLVFLHFCQILVFKNLCHTCITHTTVHMDNRLCNLMVNDHSFRVYCHNTAKRQTVFSGI